MTERKLRLNLRYYNGEADDVLPYTGEIRFDEETGLFYDEDGDVVDEETAAGFCGGDGKEDGKDE